MPGTHAKATYDRERVRSVEAETDGLAPLADQQSLAQTKTAATDWHPDHAQTITQQTTVGNVHLVNPQKRDPRLQKLLLDRVEIVTAERCPWNLHTDSLEPNAR